MKKISFLSTMLRAFTLCFLFTTSLKPEAPVEIIKGLYNDMPEDKQTLSPVIGCLMYKSKMIHNMFVRRAFEKRGWEGPDSPGWKERLGLTIPQELVPIYDLVTELFFTHTPAVYVNYTVAPGKIQTYLTPKGIGAIIRALEDNPTVDAVAQAITEHVDSSKMIDGMTSKLFKAVKEYHGETDDSKRKRLKSGIASQVQGLVTDHAIDRDPKNTVMIKKGKKEVEQKMGKRAKSEKIVTALSEQPLQASDLESFKQHLATEHHLATTPEHHDEQRRIVGELGRKQFAEKIVSAHEAAKTSNFDDHIAQHILLAFLWARAQPIRTNDQEEINIGYRRYFLEYLQGLGKEPQQTESGSLASLQAQLQNLRDKLVSLQTRLQQLMTPTQQVPTAQAEQKMSGENQQFLHNWYTKDDYEKLKELELTPGQIEEITMIIWNSFGKPYPANITQMMSTQYTSKDGTKTAQFPDCGETSNRKFWNAILYDSAKQSFDQSILEKINAHHMVKEFFKKHPTVSDIALPSTYNDWAKTCSEIPGVEYSDRGKKICEIDPGLINMSKVVAQQANISITGKKDSEIPKFIFGELTKKLASQGITLEHKIPDTIIRNSDEDKKTSYTFTIANKENSKFSIKWEFFPGHFEMWYPSELDLNDKTYDAVVKQGITENASTPLIILTATVLKTLKPILKTVSPKKQQLYFKHTLPDNPKSLVLRTDAPYIPPFLIPGILTSWRWQDRVYKSQIVDHYFKYFDLLLYQEKLGSTDVGSFEIPQEWIIAAPLMIERDKEIMHNYIGDFIKLWMNHPNKLPQEWKTLVNTKIESLQNVGDWQIASVILNVWKPELPPAWKNLVTKTIDSLQEKGDTHIAGNIIHAWERGTQLPDSWLKLVTTTIQERPYDQFLSPTIIKAWAQQPDTFPQKWKDSTEQAILSLKDDSKTSLISSEIISTWENNLDQFPEELITLLIKTKTSLEQSQKPHLKPFQNLASLFIILGDKMPQELFTKTKQAWEDFSPAEKVRSIIHVWRNKPNHTTEKWKAEALHIINNNKNQFSERDKNFIVFRLGNAWLQYPDKFPKEWKDALEQLDPTKKAEIEKELKERKAKQPNPANAG